MTVTEQTQESMKSKDAKENNGVKVDFPFFRKESVSLNKPSSLSKKKKKRKLGNKLPTSKK